MADSPSPPAAPTVPGYAILRNAAVFVAVVVAMFLVRFFQGILTPLVVATFLLLLIDAVSRVMQARIPRSSGPFWDGSAGAVDLSAIAAFGGLFVIGGPALGHQVRGREPRHDQILGGVLAWFG